VTARIDHEDQANQAAAAGKYDIAQYHATMLRAQQAKVANLIAYVDKWTDDEVLDVDAEIREALGIVKSPSPAEIAVRLRHMTMGRD